MGMSTSFCFRVFLLVGWGVEVIQFSLFFMKNTAMSFPFYFYDNHVNSNFTLIYLHENSLNNASFEKQLKSDE